MAKKSNKSMYLAALLLIVGGLGYLIFSGLSQDSVYFLNVSEALALEDGKFEQARLFGMVDEQDVERLSECPGVRFRLLDKDNAAQGLQVRFEGAVPDTFKPGVEVIVEGRYKPEERMFSASTLMTKCPSKYEKYKKENQG